MSDSRRPPAGAARQPVNALDDYVPVIDLEAMNSGDPDRVRALAAKIATACRTSGFLVTVGHGMSQSTVDSLYDAARRFFGQPDNVKNKVIADPLDPLQRGFTPDTRLQMFSANRLGEPEAWRGIDVTAAGKLAMRNKWPDVAGFRDAYLRYYQTASDLAARLARLFAVALGLPEDWFDDKFDEHMTPLTVNYYPPCPAATLPQRLRNEPHTDFTALTILYQDDAPGGLQVRHSQAGWIDVPHIPGSLVVNLGRLMTRWTNDQWASTVHRVVNPPPELSHSDRISIAFFYHPNPNTVIECIPTCLDTGSMPRYTRVVSAGYFVGTARRAYLTRRRLASGGG